MGGRILAAFGIALIVAGAFALYFAYENANAAGAAAAWAAIIGGALALLGGIGRFMTAFMGPQQARESKDGPTEVRLLVQCMATIAAADGKIQPEEMVTIARVHEKVLGLRIDADEVAEILAGFDAGFDIRARLEAARPRLSPIMRERIVKSCYLVMMSDLVEDDAETGKIHQIGEALGFSPSQVDDLVAMEGV